MSIGEDIRGSMPFVYDCWRHVRESMEGDKAFPITWSNPWACIHAPEINLTLSLGRPLFLLNFS